MKLRQMDFGSLPDGKGISLFILRNQNGMEVQITNYGGIVTAIKVPNKHAVIEDVALGFDSLEGYIDEAYKAEGPYFGALIGRFGNRIANGKFTLGGKEYLLARNNGPNHLHGGIKGFDKVVWQAQPYEIEGKVALKLQYLSPDMEEGYPGNLNVEVIYSLSNENELKIDYKATTDRKTIINLTNHSYFNLTSNSKRDILSHQVMINAEAFVPVDQTLIPKGNLADVKNTPFDFTSPKSVGRDIEAKNEQLEFGLGYDHCWVLKKNNQKELLTLAATAYEPESGRFLEVFTTEPGIQFYTGNFLTGSLKGKKGAIYRKRYGFCLETQHFPDAPNQPHFPSTVLDKDEVYTTSTVFKFSVK